MNKKYYKAELQIVHLNKTDVITTSVVGIVGTLGDGEYSAEASSRRMDDWDAGY